MVTEAKTISAVPVILPPITDEHWALRPYIEDVYKKVPLDQFLTADERAECQKMKPGYDLWLGRGEKIVNIGGLLGVVAVGINAYLNPDSIFTPSFFRWILRGAMGTHIDSYVDSNSHQEPLMEMFVAVGNLTIAALVGMVAAHKMFNRANGRLPSRIIGEYQKKCIDVPAERLEKAAEAEYKKYKEAHPDEYDRSALELSESIHSSVAAVGQEGMWGTSTLTPFEKGAARFGKNVVAPVVFAGVVVVGAIHFVKTGNASTMQRAWALAIR